MQQVHASTCDVVDLHTIDNVWLNVSEVQRRWRIPRVRETNLIAELLTNNIAHWFEGTYQTSTNLKLNKG